MTAFKHMDPRKALGIHRLLGSFFKEHWSTVGSDVLRMCQDVLQGNKNVDCVNDTLLVMIPKVKNPCEMTNFHPINLCRVIYKIISKALANQLKVVLPQCISQNQRAFVPGWMIHDNVLVAHELMHYLRSLKNGPNKGCVIKLDISKAYDQVELCFLEKVMIRMVLYRVKCNMNRIDIIIPERGLRQGDPLSPYLFLFCMDVFSRMLLKAQEKNNIKGICTSKDGPRMNHLFFVDNALLFVRNQHSEVETFIRILDNFPRMSDQSINLEKSMVYFSPNTSVTQRATLGNILDRLASRINGWSKHLLSNGGKEIFIKSVIQAIPTYAFLVFMAPKGVLEEIQSMTSHVWWGGGEKKRGWNMLPWDRLCYPKAGKVLEWHDNWGFEGLLGKSICLEKKLVKEEKLGDLFNSSKDGWNKKRVRDICGKNMGDQICNIPIIHNDPEDRCTWLHYPHGRIQPSQDLLENHVEIKNIWGFCWRLGHYFLPTSDKISSFCNGFDDTCPRCGKDMETLIHAMKDCLLAREVLEHSRLHNKFLVENYSRYIDWIEDMARELDYKVVSDLITVLWNVRNSRNTRIFRGVEEGAKVSWEREAALRADVTRKAKDKVWRKPSQGVNNINFDTSVHGKKVYYVLVAIDSEGFVHGERMGVVDKEMQIEWAEMLAMEESLNVARSNNWNALELESDCASLVNRFKNWSCDLTMLGHRMREIQRKTHCFSYFNFKWGPRCCNKVADYLCSWAKTKDCNKDFKMDYPSEVHEFVLNDAIS
ncbi:uncharacterized protein [Gossypium hirsutum]|uniref:Reverse transcriptase domain-containing protein n=1 Tax=Gossypium hirsutum TaxID=3635 RepID=A0A1U8NW09_GOSHI|nr:uncharacterized protein LOC107952399 [Gossypium hirsutum]